MKMGLERPKDWDTTNMYDFNAMRKAIRDAQLDSVLISQCMRCADYNGLNGEDRYTLLAYHALVALETYWKIVLEINLKSPIPPIITPAEM